jgi:ABC-type uncharacterized transport system auxiliary subunit
VHTQMQRPAPMMLVAAMILFFVLMSGCGKPPIATNHYLLEYPSPAFGGKPTLDESIKVELFAAAQSIRNNDMVYLPKPFETSSYVYNRWQVNPSHMVTDFLLRDLRKSNLFKGVFGYQQSGIGRFRVEGAVQQFAEVDDPDGWKAVLAVSVTLLDLNEAEITKRVIMQKNYRQAEPMPTQNPPGLAQGMSRAMEVMSAHIITDLYKAAAAARVCH